MTYTVADLLDHAALSTAALIGGAAGLSRTVTDVVLLPVADVATSVIPAGSFIVVSTDDAPEDRWLHRIDLLLRKAERADASGVVVHIAQEQPLPLASSRLADRLGLPLAIVRGPGSALPTTLGLQRFVLAPEIERASTLLLAAGVEEGYAGPEGVVDRLERAVGGEVAIVARDHIVAGDADAAAIRWARSRKQRATAVRAGHALAVVPFGSDTESPDVWVLLTRHEAGPAWSERAIEAAAMTRGDVLMWLSQQRLAADHDARSRSTLLSEILEHGDSLAADVRTRAEAAGWPLAGWHTGVHIRVDGGQVGGWSMQSAIDAIEPVGLTLGAMVERSDGWAGWTTSEHAPSPGALPRLGRALQAVAESLGGSHTDLAFAVGIGSPARDAVGISTTLTQARQAALVAASSGEPGAVRAVHDLGASRLLLGWYGSAAFRDLAEQILRPLLETGEDELVTTLRAYLDRACSAAHTARVLGVHRNTIGQRIARIERILGASLSSPETRLALQLALRARTP